MSVLDVKRTKQDFLKKKGKSDSWTSWLLYFLTFSFFMNDKEKLEAIQQIIDEISSDQHNYLGHESLLAYFERQIKKILES